MRKTTALIIPIYLVWAFPLLPTRARGQDSQRETQKQHKYEMTTYQLCLLVSTSKWNLADFQRLRDAHTVHLKALLSESGKGLIAGPFSDGGKYRGVVVLDAESIEAARSLAEQDPLVKEGLVTVEAHPWFAAKGIMKKSTVLEEMPVYYFGLLVRGPSWTPGTSPELQALQTQHMAHMQKTAEAGKLVIAGPLSDSGNIRGILVYKVASLEEAKALAEADPAVKAGRFSVEVHPWSVPRASLP